MVKDGERHDASQVNEREEGVTICLHKLLGWVFEQQALARLV